VHNPGVRELLAARERMDPKPQSPAYH